MIINDRGLGRTWVAQKSWDDLEVVPTDDLLFLVFAFAEAFEDGEAGFFGVADGKRFEFDGGAEGRNDFAHRLLARGTGFELGSAYRATQGEVATTDHAVSIAKFVFVKWHQFFYRERKRSWFLTQRRNPSRGVESRKSRAKKGTDSRLENFTKNAQLFRIALQRGKDAKR